MTLEEAQRAKVRHICEKLALGPDDHVLEIGCGWGGFAIQAATEYGCRVTGLTLSPSQAGLARERVAAAGLADRIEIREQDYRLTEGRFTKIASIEMFEAIGLAEYDNYFSAIDRLLTRGGLACIQTIGVPDWRFERYRRRPDWIQQTIFPGSLLPSLEAIAKAVAGTQLQINGVEEIGFGYARTLREWRENVDRNVDQDPLARLRRAVPAPLALLPHLLRGGLRDPLAARHADRAEPLRERRAARVPPCPAGVLSYETLPALADAGRSGGSTGSRCAGTSTFPSTGRSSSSATTNRCSIRSSSRPRSRGRSAISASPSCGAFRCSPGGSPASRRSRSQRGKSDVGAIASAIAALEAGEVVGIFPEGGVMREGPWLRGAARMALATGAPLLPVRLLETRKALGRRGFGFPRLAVLIGEPIAVARTTPTPELARELTDRLQARSRRSAPRRGAVRTRLDPDPTARRQAL